jgi:ATP-binding cassette, subfamily B, bacterial
MRSLLHRVRRALTAPVDGSSGVAPAPARSARALFVRFWPFARPYRRALALSVVFLLAVPAAESAGIWLFKLVVDQVLVPRDAAALVPIVGAYLGLALVGGAVSFADDYLAAWIGERFVLDVRVGVFSHLHALSLEQLDRRRLGDVVQRLTGDIQAIERFILSGLAEGLQALARVAFFSAALALLSWKLALASIVVVPLFYCAARRCSRLIKQTAREHRRRSGSLAAIAEESLGNAALVQTLNRQADEVDRFRHQSAGIMEAELAATRIRAAFTPLVDLIELLGAIVVIALGVWVLTTGELSLGGLLAFLAYLTQLYGPLRDLGGLANSMFASAAGAERVAELLGEVPLLLDRDGARRVSSVRGHIELRDVSYRHPNSRTDALRGVSLRVRAGETIAIDGPSGAGKTTLIRVLARLTDPGSGAVMLDGHDLRDLELASVREHVGVLLQDTFVHDGTVRDAIAYGRASATDEEIAAAAGAAGALDVGLDRPVGQHGVRLSGGERRRVAIARALVRNTPVLVLDEPTSGLDAGARDSVIAALRELTKGRTTVVISHDPAVLALADRTVHLRDGRIVADTLRVAA